MGRSCSKYGEEKYAYRILVGIPEEMRNTDICERKILNWTLEKERAVVWNGLFWLRIVRSGGFF
jgi:hypothetical protein